MTTYIVWVDKEERSAKGSRACSQQLGPFHCVTVSPARLVVWHDNEMICCSCVLHTRLESAWGGDVVDAALAYIPLE